MRFATTRRVLFLVMGLAVAAVVGAVSRPSPAQAKPPANRSLMETMSEWSYPGARPLGGASMSDGGNPAVQDVKCQAVLTTPDPFEKVVAFYAKKLGTDTADEPKEPGAESKEADAKSVADQDDSKGRPVQVRVFVVNREESSTTLAISRARGETLTHIAWLHYLRLEDRR